MGSVLDILKSSTSPTCSSFHFSIPYENPMPRPYTAVFFFCFQVSRLKSEEKKKQIWTPASSVTLKVFHWCRTKENSPAISSQWVSFPVFSRLIPQSMRLRVLVSPWLLVLFRVMYKRRVNELWIRQAKANYHEKNIHAAKTLILKLLKSTIQDSTAVETQVVS